MACNKTGGKTISRRRYNHKFRLVVSVCNGVNFATVCLLPYIHMMVPHPGQGFNVWTCPIWARLESSIVKRRDFKQFQGVIIKVGGFAVLQALKYGVNPPFRYLWALVYRKYYKSAVAVASINLILFLFAAYVDWTFWKGYGSKIHRGGFESCQW